MSRPSRSLSLRGSLQLALVGTLALGLVACGDESNGAGTAAPDGFVSADYMHERALSFLRHATEGFSPDPINIIAHIEREAIDPPYKAPLGQVPDSAFDGQYQSMDTLRDTRDFGALYLLNLMLGYRGHPTVSPALWQSVEDALVRFKTWFTHPTPEGKSDDSYYWTENHQLIYRTIQYLVGQEYPDRALSTDGRPGREHMAEARAQILRWFEHKARWGFVEWHSNVYYQKDLTPLLTLAEYADDPEISTRAAALLDVLLFEMALHNHKGGFVATHGRSYKKDKMTSLDDDTWNGMKLLFDESTFDYESGSAPDATLLARAKRYRLPEAILRVGKTKESFVDSEHIGLPMDELGPVTQNPVGPFGLSYTDPANLDIWWGMSALTSWPVVPLTVQTFNDYNLWDHDLFTDFAALKPLTTNIGVAQNLAATQGRLLSFALLKEVHTYTYRTADFLMSSALDYRKGSFGDQIQSWQVAFDPNAKVFTTHPFRPPLKSTNWREDTETGSYWTGEASIPRSAQHENVGIHIYAPQYRPTNPAPFNFFHFELYTHAYFPQDHFDEVTQHTANGEGTWTFGRKGDGYVALYSYRPVEWISYDPNEIATNGMVKPFDLRANGGPNNVWIVECGRAADGQTFEQFQAAVAAAAVTVTPKGALTSTNTAFDVTYQSPSQGAVTFGWDAPFTVGGATIPLDDARRFNNPFAQSEYNGQSTHIEVDGYGLDLDVAAGTRSVTPPES